ncbi:hypothetical protein [Candidatus Pristimantibacillus sp. PTI5]|uniref:hypothetical protein n=1 Tax=Candidatus Pristimantibacillus sp. PTI5 TaxID=3400422 RepID=UPI003B02074A
MDSIKEVYRARRLMKRIRLREIAELLGCTKGLIGNWENGKGYMSESKVTEYMRYIDDYENELSKYKNISKHSKGEK